MLYNGSNNFLFANGVNIYQIKAKNSELKLYPSCLDNILKDFSVDSMKKTGLNGYEYDFSVDYNAIDISDIMGIHKYVMNKT